MFLTLRIASIRETRYPGHQVRVWEGEAGGQTEAQQREAPPAHLSLLLLSGY